MTIAYTLDAASLWSKWGFSDGELLNDVVYVAMHQSAALREADAVVTKDKWVGTMAQQVLCETVRRYLLPLLPGIEVEEIGTSHNPIRVKDASGHNDAPDNVKDVRIEVSISQVLDVLCDLALDGRKKDFFEAAVVSRVEALARADRIFI